MPWNVHCKPATNYKFGTVSLGNVKLPYKRISNKSVTIQNLGVKKFRSLLRKKKRHTDDFVVYQVRNINSLETRLNDMKQEPDDPEVQALKGEFSSVFVDNFPAGLPPQRDVEHHIEVDPDSTPPHRGIFELSPAELIATKEYITDLLKKRKIRPSKLPYGAPLFFVNQKGQLRGVIDYRALNRITKHNNAPITRTDKMFDCLGQAQFFSKLDLKTGFHQIRISPDDVEKTAFKTKYGNFEFLVMPMGLRNAPATFQALMNSIFGDCIEDFIVIYLDDILIFSESREDHLRHLRLVLSRLKEHQLYIGKKKFELMLEETEFLGLIVGESGVKIGDDRSALIRDWPTPQSISELRSFLGLVQFFRHFIQHFSRISAPLTNLTRKNSSLSQWNSDCDKAFDQQRGSSKCS